ncbi:MAG: hypothetical protein MR804_01270 [Limosilactobacillus reuteri]|nr:hypothetical protein [Limosilactobacillus reuteri]
MTADADITWHYDIATDNVVVTNLQLKLNRQNPPKRGGGFWDTFIFTQPQAQLPTETGTFLGSNGDLDYIKTAHDVWDKVLSGRNDVYAYFSQNNKTEENSIIYNLQNFKPYNAQKNADGSWTLLSVFDRWNWHLNGGDSDPLGVRWGKDSVAATLKGIPPVRKTTEVHYHYNPSAIDLHFPNNIDDRRFKYLKQKRAPIKRPNRFGISNQLILFCTPANHSNVNIITYFFGTIIKHSGTTNL